MAHSDSEIVTGSRTLGIRMAPLTRSHGLAPVASIPLNPPIVQSAIKVAERVVPILIPKGATKLTKLKEGVIEDSTVEKAQYAYKQMASLWRDTLIEAELPKIESVQVAGYAECGDYIKDRLQPFADKVAASFRGCRLSDFPARWDAAGGATNMMSRHSTEVRRVMLQVYPLLPQQDHQTKLAEIYSLMSVYADRCRRFHHSVRHLSAQEFWHFLCRTEESVLQREYHFPNPDQNLHLLRAIQDDKDHYYVWSNHILYYRTTGEIINA